MSGSGLRGMVASWPRIAYLTGLSIFVLVVLSVVALQGRDARPGASVELKPKGDGALQAATRSAPAKVTAIGDSVLLAASDVLRGRLPAIDVDAVVGRGVDDGVAALARRAAAGTLGDAVLVHLGNNGEFTEQQFEEIADLVGPNRELVFVTVRVPRSWEADNNAVIARGVSRHANAVLVDWHRASATDASLLWDDGVHLRPDGVAAYSHLVLKSLNAQ